MNKADILQLVLILVQGEQNIVYGGEVRWSVVEYFYIITWLFLYWPEYVPCKHVFSWGP